jgi:hypothetical protein
MKKSYLVRLVILLMTILSLAGCLLIPVDDGFHGGGHNEGGGGHHEERHDRR